MSGKEQEEPEDKLINEIRSRVIRECHKCKKKFKPTTDGQKVCFACFQSNDSSTPRAADRKREASSSPQQVEEAKRNKMDVQVEKESSPLQGIDLENLESLSPNNMAQVIRSIAKAYKEQMIRIEEMAMENSSLKQELINVKLAFADHAFKIIATGTNTTYASVLKGSDQDYSGKAVLVAESTEKVDINQVDNLLGSRSNGPVAQAVRQKEKKVILTFSDTKDRDAAQKIMESSSEAKKVFKSIAPSTRYYPIIAKYANLEHGEEAILSEIKYRNPILRDYLASIKVIFKSHDPNIGHIKLWLTSAVVRNDIVRRGELFLPGRRCRVALPDLNFEVKRCFKCQQYGHLVKDCKATTDVCGKCTGNHRTSLCTVKDQSKMKCINCMRVPRKNNSTPTGVGHPSGDKTCPAQIRAMERYKTTYGL